MKILLVNKFLYPKGGSETYMMNLGRYMQSVGHAVQYFGMDSEERTVCNEVDSYTLSMDFHNGSFLDKILYSVKTIYSEESRRKIRLVLDDFQPDDCHLNNFVYQLTPSIILEIVKWRKESGKNCKIVYTAHDLQLVCPNHLMTNPISGEICENCLGGKYVNCIKGKCIHGSTLKSVVGATEAWYWNKRKVYENLDFVICPSKFLADKLSSNPILKNKIIVMHNFIDVQKPENVIKKDYVLFYGRYSKEKGIETLLSVADKLPDVKFVFAGQGPLNDEINKRKNIENKGFLSGESLSKLISEAVVTVVPSECPENCPFTVMESQMYGTPVIGADIGGIPELIIEGETGELFESGSEGQLKILIETIIKDNVKSVFYSKNCDKVRFDTTEMYFDKLVKLYKQI